MNFIQAPEKPDNADIMRPQFTIAVSQGDKDLGTMTIELFNDIAPNHAANFEELANEGAYNGTAFHRVIPNFMIQGGDPNSIDKPRNTWGMGSPDQKHVNAEFNNIHHSRGILSAARAMDPDSASSQFFVCVTDVPHLNGQYSVFGRVLEGMDVADVVVNSERDNNDGPLEKISMEVKKIS